jgi:hypothetical protein
MVAVVAIVSTSFYKLRMARLQKAKLSGTGSDRITGVEGLSTRVADELQD